MATISYSIPIIDQPNSTEDPKIADALTKILALVNGQLDSGNFASTFNPLAFVGSAGGHKFACGTSTAVTIPSSALNVSWSATHGLGATPIWAVACAFNGFCHANLTSWNGTTLSGQVWYIQPSGAGSGSFFQPSPGVTQNITWAAVV